MICHVPFTVQAENKAVEIEIKGDMAKVTLIRPDGTAGTAHDEFNVAHGTGKNCPNCGTPIERIVVRTRGTYYCPKCQVKP